MKIVNKFDKRLLFLVLGLIAVFKFTESRVMSLTFVVAYTGVVFFYPALKPKTPEEQPRPLTPEEEEALKAEKEEQEKMKALKAAEAARKLREAEEAKRKEEEEEKKKKKKKQEENDIPPPAAAPSKEEKEEIPPPPLPVQEEKEVQHTRKKSVIPPPPPPATVPLDPKVKTKIWNMVMQELIDTEKYYIFMLGEIRTIYINPLKESKLVSAENIKEIFGIVEIIESYNNEAILKEFQKWGQEGVTVGQIFNKFTRNATYLKTYSSYINNFDHSALVLSKLRKSNSKFSRFLDKQTELPESFGQNLESLLIMPVQRIPRYILLLRELIKNSVATDPDLPLLEDAFTALSEIAALINTNKREAESSEKVYAIQENLIGLSHPLVSPSRRFVKEGVLNYLEDFRDMAKFDKAKKRRTVYLFNDLLVTAKGDKKLYITSEFPLSDIRVTTTTTSDSHTVMVITYGGKVCAYTDGDGGNVAEWVQAINKEKDSIEAKRMTFLRPSK